MRSGHRSLNRSASAATMLESTTFDRASLAAMRPFESQRRFLFLREIASGGFGCVFLAEMKSADDSFSRYVAVKMLHAKWSGHLEVAARMRDEARLLGKLSHKNIVDVFDLTRIDGRVAVVMEYLKSVDLKGLSNAVTKAGGHIPLTVCCGIISSVASALDAAYNHPPVPGASPLRVIHRDIKPSNVMLDGHGVVKVLDFGGARVEMQEREAETQRLTFGSMPYMAPERVCHEPEGPNSDVYSLGATLYELLAGERLGKAKLKEEAHISFVKGRLEDLEHPDLTGDVRAATFALIEKMLAFDAEDRMNAAEVRLAARALGRTATGPAVDEYSEEMVEPLVKQMQERSAVESSDPIVGQSLTEDRWLSASMSTPIDLDEPADPGLEAVAFDNRPTVFSEPDDEDAADSVASEALASITGTRTAPGPEASGRSGGGLPLRTLTLAISSVALAVAVGMMWNQPAPEVVEPPPPEPDIIQPLSLNTNKATFRIADASVVKLTVNCSADGASAKDGVVQVKVTDGDECMFTAQRTVSGARERFSGTITDVSARDYRCFVDGSDACQ